MPDVLEASLTVRVVDSLRQVAAPDWDALVSEDSPFIEWRFLQALEEAGCVDGAAADDTGWRPLHILIFAKAADGGETLVAAAPAYLKGHSQGEFVFDWEWASFAERIGVRYYPKLVVAVPFSPATGTRLLVHPAQPPEAKAALQRLLCATLRQLAEQLEVSSVHVLFHTEAEGEALAQAGFLSRLGVQFHWYNRGYQDFSDYLAQFNAKRRHMLRRERAEVHKAGIQVTTRRGPFSPAETAEMYRLYVSTVDKFHWGRRYLNPRFFELLAERMPEHLELVVAKGPDSPAGPPFLGGAINLVKGRRLYGRYWGQGQEEHRFLHFEVCYYHSIEESIARGVQVFEPGAGGEHKLARGFEPTLTRSAHLILDRRLAGPLRAFLVREEAAVRASVSAALAELPAHHKKAGPSHE